MPRVNTKKKNKAGKSYPCGQCSEPIKAGEQYYEWSFRYGGTHRQHISHGYPKQSQLTQSKMSGVYAAIESAEQTINTSDEPEEITQALNDCASEVEQVKDEYQDGIDNLPEQFQNSSPNIEKVDNLDSFIAALQETASSIESDSFEEEEPKVPEGHEAPCEKVDADGADCTCGKDDYETEHEEWEQKREEWLDELRQQAMDALGELSE